MSPKGVDGSRLNDQIDCEKAVPKLASTIRDIRNVFFIMILLFYAIFLSGKVIDQWPLEHRALHALYYMNRPQLNSPVSVPAS